jgi:DNA-binding PadR family transcriptional regulator
MEKVAEAWGTEMRRGHTKLAVLTLLSNKPLTGYDLMKEIEERTLGFWKLTPGGVYPILRELEKKGYITGTRKPQDSRRRKIYEMTEAGQQLLKTALQKQQQIAQTMRHLMSEYTRDILHTEFPEDLPSLPPNLFSVVTYLKGKPPEEQQRILTKIRARLLTLLNWIDALLAKITRESN